MLGPVCTGRNEEGLEGYV